MDGANRKICRTPLYQILTRALSDKANKTKFKLLFSNVTEADILLREEFDALKKKHPDTFDVVYVLGKPDSKWQGEPSGVLKYPPVLTPIIPGPSGFINADLVKKHVAPASLKEKVKIFVCGMLFSPSNTVTH